MANIDLAAYFKGGKHGSNNLSGDKGATAMKPLRIPRLFQNASRETRGSRAPRGHQQPCVAALDRRTTATTTASRHTATCPEGLGKKLFPCRRFCFCFSSTSTFLLPFFAEKKLVPFVVASARPFSYCQVTPTDRKSSGNQHSVQTYLRLFPSAHLHLSSRAHERLHMHMHSCGGVGGWGGA